MKKLFYQAIISAFAVGHAQTACAQMDIHSIGNWQLSSNIAAVNSIINQENLVSINETVKSRDASRSRVTLIYTPSKSRTRSNLQNFIAKTRAVDPAGAAQLEALFASSDILDQIGAAMQSVGLSRNNAADAYALYWVNAWQVANGDASTPSRQTMQAVSAQAARGLTQSAEFAAANDAQKQEMAEALMIQGALIASAFAQAAGDTAQLKAVANAVAKGAKASGLDLSAMTLTEKGFVTSKTR